MHTIGICLTCSTSMLYIFLSFMKRWNGLAIVIRRVNPSDKYINLSNCPLPICNQYKQKRNLTFPKSVKFMSKSNFSNDIHCKIGEINIAVNVLFLEYISWRGTSLVD